MNRWPPPAAIQWQCSWGTITNPSAGATTYQAGHLDPDDPPTVVMLTVTADAEVRTRELFVFPDNLSRDMATFMGGTNTHPLPWWNHPSNCHGTTLHAHGGTGNLNGGFTCPFSYCAYELIYHREQNGNVLLDDVDECDKERGYIVSYVAGTGSNPSHSATLTSDGGIGTWELNGGVPPNNHFRTDVIHKDLSPGSELRIFLHYQGD